LLLGFHSNYGSTLYHFRDKARYRSKIVTFSYPSAFDAPVRGVPVKILIRHVLSTVDAVRYTNCYVCMYVCIRSGTEKLEWCGYPIVESFDQDLHLTDGQTEKTDIGYVLRQHTIDRAVHTHRAVIKFTYI